MPLPFQNPIPSLCQNLSRVTKIGAIPAPKETRESTVKLRDLRDLQKDRPQAKSRESRVAGLVSSVGVRNIVVVAAEMCLRSLRECRFRAEEVHLVSV